MPTKEDLRVRRTKKALFDAFMQLLCEKPFDEITVNELCDVAGIRRATFYKHYSDKYDFLTAYTRLLRDRFDRLIWNGDKPILTPDYYVAYASKVIHFIGENSAAVKNICNSNMFPAVVAIVIEQNYKDTCDRLRISVANGLQLDASIETVAAMCSGGIAACIYGWLKQGQIVDPDTVAEQVGAIVSNIIRCK
ncbi:MAG: TetR/AcrR family transcriptional regulator [Clostridia bacterium]|nr:TetR/AcrR family transcriptional regulator [Clostridia bacterium]